jgi:hypothetical protein
MGSGESGFMEEGRVREERAHPTLAAFVMRARRADRHAQDVGRLLHGHVLVEDKMEHFPLARGQRVEGALKKLLHRRMVGGRLVLGGGRERFRGGPVVEQAPSAENRSPVQVDRGLADDGEQPRLEIRAAVEAGAARENLPVGGLQRILRFDTPAPATTERPAEARGVEPFQFTAQRGRVVRFWRHRWGFVDRFVARAGQRYDRVSKKTDSELAARSGPHKAQEAQNLEFTTSRWRFVMMSPF